VGFQDEWTYVDPRSRSVSFTNLDPGKYVFRVRASGSSGDWRDQASELRITRMPSFWETVWFRLVLLAFFLTAIVLYIRYLDWKRRKEHEREVFVAQQEILRLRNAQLLSEVGRKNSELSAALLQSAHKNKTLEGLRQQLSEISAKMRYGGHDGKELRRLVRKIDAEVDSTDYWEQFLLNFDQVHQDFSQKLRTRHPDLTLNEIRLSCLIRIQLTNREIASIQNISISGVEKAKYRLKRKLNLEPKEDLNLHITNLF
jgi:DNA-binding CsgD family transcriptional regulator